MGGIWSAKFCQKVFVEKFDMDVDSVNTMRSLIWLLLFVPLSSSFSLSRRGILVKISFVFVSIIPTKCRKKTSFHIFSFKFFYFLLSGEIREFTTQDGEKMLIRRSMVSLKKTNFSTIHRARTNDAKSCAHQERNSASSAPALITSRTCALPGVIWRCLYLKPGEWPSHNPDVRKRCKCTCRSKYYNDGWYCCSCPDTTCFPSTSTVHLSNGVERPMYELKKGDFVRTGSQTLFSFSITGRTKS